MKVYRNCMEKNIVNNNFDSFLNEFPLKEAVLIEWNFNEILNQVTLVSDVIDWTLPRGRRKFLKTTFFEVSDYKHRLSRPNYMKKFGPNYSSQTPYTVLIYDIEIFKTKKRPRLSIDFGSSFGQIEFNFLHLEYSSRIGKGIKEIQTGWVYKDIDNGKEFEFTSPFEN
ncbi:MAG: hypothetical protein H6560_03025 [Lewinellaceae bacterium]|nr:hypothetical protein [Lewinellaceae bacterium]